MTIQGAKKLLQIQAHDDPKRTILSKLEEIKASLEQLNRKL